MKIYFENGQPVVEIEKEDNVKEENIEKFFNMGGKIEIRKMTKQQIFNKLSEILKGYTDYPATMDTEIVRLGLDSLDAIEFIIEVDTYFNLPITDIELQKMFSESKKVKNLVEKIQKCLKK